MINPDIKKASTPPGTFYSSAEIYEQVKEKIFTRSWQFAGDRHSYAQPDHLYPFWFSKGCLNEPLLMRTDGQMNISCTSNVCTHRGFVLVEEDMPAQTIRCRYHGRCFSADGKFISMPEFGEAENFPSAMDNLSQLTVKEWGGMFFTALFPLIPFEEIMEPLTERMSWFPLTGLTFSAEHSRDYHIEANWALYCDNYLEGFHIPYVHKSLNKIIDYGNYETTLFPHCNLQTGIAKDNDLIFDIPDNSPDAGKKIAAYYWWIFPNMMLNFYPWGLSLNIVQPTGPHSCTVSFRTYIADGSKFNQGAGSDLNRVETEDEEVVESVQRGLQSRLYFRGRYSPKMEKGPHQFHQLMQRYLAEPA